MVMLAAALAIASPDPAIAQLRKLEYRLERFVPYPIESPSHNSDLLLDDYRKLAEKFGPSGKVGAGLARCAFSFGFYSEAAKAYEAAGPDYRAQRERATYYADLAQTLTKKYPAGQVSQILQVGKQNYWVALFNSRQGLDSSEVRDRPERFVQFKVDPDSHGVREIKKLPLPEREWAGNHDFIYLANLSQRDKTPYVMFFRQEAADCQPFAIRFYKLSSKGLRTFRDVGAMAGAWVRGPSKGHGLLIMLGPLWHVGWADLYEWNGGRFVLSNRRFPEYFPFEKEGRTDLEDWMDYAAELDIHRRYREAKAVWKKAIHECHATISADAYYEDRPFPRSLEGGVEGAPDEIRRRIRWLNHHDYNHIELYRPIDHGLGPPTEDD